MGQRGSNCRLDAIVAPIKDRGRYSRFRHEKPTDTDCTASI